MSEAKSPRFTALEKLRADRRVAHDKAVAESKGNTTRVRMLCAMTKKKGTIREGQEVDFPDFEAAALVENERAVYVDGRKKGARAS